ncbi:MAG TPA: hypothetical protein PLB63_11685 [Planctomycetota bacterium]|nr:hypothetical protein [Planctomycetota bacterium]HQB01580.1 hypothetical protein [Planctomycetota bacterium]
MKFTFPVCSVCSGEVILLWAEFALGSCSVVYPSMWLMCGLLLM